jgi:hypothetical protein
MKVEGRDLRWFECFEETTEWNGKRRLIDYKREGGKGKEAADNRILLF